MAYTDDTETDEMGAGTPPTKPAAASGDEGDYKSFFLPEEALAELPPNLKAGDIVKFKVVGKDADGNVEVVCDHGDMQEKGEDLDGMGEDLESAMPEHMGGRLKPQETEI